MSVCLFWRFCFQVNWLTERLESAGIIAAPLSGESSKDDRAEIMRRLQVKHVNISKWLFSDPKKTDETNNQNKVEHHLENHDISVGLFRETPCNRNSVSLAFGVRSVENGNIYRAAVFL